MSVKPYLVAVVQDSAPISDTATALQLAREHIREAAEIGAKLVVLPEAFIGGYPKGEDFGVRIGRRSNEGREAFVAYAAGAITVPGPETDSLGELAHDLGVQLVIGVIERDGGTLYCTALGFDETGKLRSRHRKVMPTALERVIWGFGDGSTLDVWQTPLGNVGAVICWENYMPLLRASMYAQGIELYCAPTVDDRETWLPTMRHIAIEGRCFVLSACQYRESKSHPEQRINGGSCIISPFGEVLAGPVFGKPVILTATINPALRTAGQFDLDVTGHYARPDIFKLQVDRGKATTRQHHAE